MSLRAPILLTALLVALVAAISMFGDTQGLLLLTPALAVLLPLLLGSYPGEGSVRVLASWFSRIKLADGKRAALLAVHGCDMRAASPGFSSANGSRGPPLLSA